MNNGSYQSLGNFQFFCIFTFNVRLLEGILIDCRKYYFFVCHTVVVAVRHKLVFLNFGGYSIKNYLKDF